MKGKLINKQGNWIVRYIPEYIHNDRDEIFNCEPDKKELPLHPFTNPYMWGYKEGDEIDFKIVEHKVKDKLVDIAEIIDSKQESEEETWDDIIEAFHEQSTINYFEDYLKANYLSPKPIKK